MKYRGLSGLPWREQPVYIVGGGPSANSMDLAALSGIIVGVNDSALHAPRADVAFSASPPWIRQRLQFIADFPGAVVLMSAHGPGIARRYQIRRPVVGLPLRPTPGESYRQRIRCHNSGHEALRWVADMGARKIVLVGFDLDPAEPTNWHGGYEWQPDKTADPTFDYGAWVGAFQESAKLLASKGIQVWNANPDSRLRCFPFLEPAAAL